MHIQQETITPADARALLATRPDEVRVLRRSLVTRLTAAVLRGEWYCTHQPIAIGKDGRLLDGQHRLSACVAADKPITTLVARGVDQESQVAVDRGASRNTHDSLTLTGHVCSRDEICTVRVMISSSGPLVTGRGASQYTDEAVWAMLERYRPLIGAVIRKTSTRALDHLQAAPSRAALTRFAHQVGLNLTLGFCDAIITMDTSRSNIAIMTAMALSRTPRRDINKRYRLLEAGLRVWGEGRSVQLLRPADYELFPLPEDDRTKRANGSGDTAVGANEGENRQAAARPGGRLGAAMAVIQARMMSGQPPTKKGIMAEAAVAGFCPRTIRRALRELGLVEGVDGLMTTKDMPAVTPVLKE